jgi:bifunctional non-homologous end joining protein LigD
MAKDVVLNEIITHPDKVYWPKLGYTKADLLDYYDNVSSYILPHLKNRPIVMHRFPEGIEGEDFYHKQAPDFIPEWIERAEVQHSDKKIDYVMIQDLKSLLYVVNLGSIELHPFLARFENVDRPDFLVIDLDPQGLTYDTLIEVAQEIHKLFTHLHISHFCKTSGKRGLHVYMPLHAKYEYSQVEDFAKLLAHIIHNKMPEITSVVRDPSKRQKKVYIDYLQNGRTKNVVAPYSVRPTPDATVSTPLEWKEVRKGFDPKDFTIQTVPSRLAKKGDLFKAVLGKGINLQDILKKLEKVKI